MKKRKRVRTLTISFLVVSRYDPNFRSSSLSSVTRRNVQKTRRVQILNAVGNLCRRSERIRDGDASSKQEIRIFFNSASLIFSFLFFLPIQLFSYFQLLYYVIRRDIRKRCNHNVYNKSQKYPTLNHSNHCLIIRISKFLSTTMAC